MANNGQSAPTPEEVAQEKARLIASEMQEQHNAGPERDRLLGQLETHPECAAQTSTRLLQLGQEDARQRLAASGIAIARHTGGGVFLVVHDDALPGLFEHPGA
jgi:hypothetical protein